jgi:hypothetical protein
VRPLCCGPEVCKLVESWRRYLPDYCWYSKLLEFAEFEISRIDTDSFLEMELWLLIVL